MKVGLDDVRKIFEDLLAHQISREAADRWAYSIMQASEQNTLVFEPRSAEQRIWTCVMFIFGIDLQESPGHYMFTDEDIRDAMLKNLDE
jgi:hypothetical protein